MYSASTVVICWPAWMRPSSATALCPSPAAPMPSVVCRRAVNSRSVSKQFRPVAVTSARASLLGSPGLPARAGRIAPSQVARTATTSSRLRADDGTYQARSAVNSAPVWSAHVIAIADQVSRPSPRSTRDFVSPSVRDSSSLPRA